MTQIYSLENFLKKIYYGISETKFKKGYSNLKKILQPQNTQK